MNINNCPFCNNELRITNNSKFCTYNMNTCGYWFEVKSDNSILIITFLNKLKLNYKNNNLLIKHNNYVFLSEKHLELNISEIVCFFKKYENKIKENLIFT